MPFSLRLIHAELPQHNGRPNVALDRLYALLEKVEQVLRHLEQGLSEDGSEADLSSTGESDSAEDGEENMCREELTGKYVALRHFTLFYL